MKSLRFQLVTPERTVLSEELDSLSCPTTQGQITILPGHIPLVAALEAGELVAKSGREERYIHVSGGFVEIRPDNEVIVLADAAEHYYEIDAERAQAARDRAVQAMKETTMSGQEYAKVAASLERSLSRLNIVRKRAHTRTSPVTSEGVFRE